MQIHGSSVIITGAGSGVGRALAVAFARAGGRVACVGRRLERLEETVSAIAADGGEAVALQADVTDQAQVDRLMTQVVERFGAIDVLFNNAGSFQTLGAVWEVDPDRWWQDVTVNLRGPMLCCRAAIPHMIRRGRGILINMRGGDRIPGGTGYSCSKVALTRFTELLAKELERKETGVLCFGMGPGFVRTEMTELQLATPEGRYWLPSSREAVERGRDRSPADCARAAVRLVEVACRALNGQAFGPDTDFDEALREAGA